MRKVREVLRLRHERGRSCAEIAASIGIGESTVFEFLGCVPQVVVPDQLRSAVSGLRAALFSRRKSASSGFMA